MRAFRDQNSGTGVTMEFRNISNNWVTSYSFRNKDIKGAVVNIEDPDRNDQTNTINYLNLSWPTVKAAYVILSLETIK